MGTRCKRTYTTACAFAAIGLAAPATAAAAVDPLLAQQWALATPSPIGAQEAWTQATGAGVLVAVIDTGIQLDHPDLAGSVWTNAGEIPANGVDDDANGIVDDVHGANMFNLSGDVGDDNGHGTHVAGVIGARRDNAIGGSGLAPEATILPVKVLDSSRAGDTDTLAHGIRYAVDRGAKILNVSVNTDVATDAVASAVRYAGDHGAIVVASAGNDGRDIDVAPSFPAGLPDPAVLSVAADDSNGAPLESSNRGPTSVHLAAPGAAITSTATGSSYQARTGTSAAAPFASASLALLAQVRPDLPMSALRSTLIDTSQRPDRPGSLLGGRLDVGAAMHSILPAGRWMSPAPAPAPAPAQAPSLRLRTQAPTRAGARNTVRWSSSHAGSVRRWRVSLDGHVVASTRARASATTRRIARKGRHTWRVAGFTSDGTQVIAALHRFRVLPGR